jgi:geranylgeranyl diphosphate synthase, type II
MFSFKELTEKFAGWFAGSHFPASPENLYEPGTYFLHIGGKRIRPVLCLMANELFSEIKEDAYYAATAIELFHNFTLIHDDIMDNAPLRRGMETVHAKYGSNTAILSGDVMLIVAYEKLSQVAAPYLPQVLQLFNTTAREVCEGQQLDMDFETRAEVKLDEYIEMIALKTSVLLASSLKTGSIIGNASTEDCHHIYEFGRNLGIAFQVQDDYLDAFGDPEKFGKDVGGDIRQNKKTFLLINALETCKGERREALDQLLAGNEEDKVSKVLAIFKECKVDEWADRLKDDYYAKAMQHLDAISVEESRKKPLRQLAAYLLQREY